MKKFKKEPWRIVVAILSICFIAFLWIKKDIVAIYATTPEDQILPLIVTTVTVSLLKVAGIAVVVFFVKLIVDKIRKKGKDNNA